MIVCEVGNIPPHSVPVVIREIFADSLDEEEDVLDDSDSISSEGEALTFDSNTVAEKDEEDDEEEEAKKLDLLRDSSKQKRIAERMKILNKK